MHRRTFLIGALVLVACSPAAEKAAPAAEADDPAAVVRPIYARYMPGAPAFQYPDLKDQAPWSASLRQAMIDQDARFAAVTDGDPEGIDFDVFVNGQDWQLANLNVVAANVVAHTRALVRATFVNSGTPVEVDYDMVWENGGWRIDDMRSGVGADAWDLRALVAK